MFLIRVLLLMCFAVCAQASTPAAWVFDVTDNRVITGEENNTVRPIASLTKLMTAIVVLDSNDNLEEKLLLIRRQVSTALPFKHYTRLELLNAMLVKSDNAAAETLSENYPGGRERFLAAMNARAQELGMINTVFSDPTGLSRDNVSMPSEVGKMLAAAEKYPMIRSISTQTQTQVDVGVKKRSTLALGNTNAGILTRFRDIVVSKTGFTNPAGFCLGMVVDKHQRKFIIVVMGEANKMRREATVGRIMKMI